ncbi:MAG: redoxin domain-containing protein [Nanoarchaeota archaeon]|nr:redoxin domain-containing protein [Nanoarchaeota archaeon]
MRKAILLITIILLTACQETSNLDDIKARIEQQQALVTQHDDLVTQPNEGTNVGDKAPDFIVIDIENNIIQLSTFEKPTIAYFFATWCPYCRQDLNVLKEVIPNYKDKVNIIAIDLDISETKEQLENYKAEFGMDIPFAIATLKILQDYQVTHTTSKYAIKNGNMIYAGSGAFSKEQWELLLNKLA